MGKSCKEFNFFSGGRGGVVFWQWGEHCALGLAGRAVYAASAADYHAAERLPAFWTGLSRLSVNL